MRAGLLTLFIAVILPACAHYDEHDETSYFYTVPEGSSLTLNRSVIILPEQVSVYMQDGRLIELALIDRYQPYCKFEVYRIAETSRDVKPDRFTITRVVEDTEMTSAFPMPPVASFGFASGIPAVYTYSTYFSLHSDKQPDVFRMTCMHWESIIDDHYLTVPQMREAMGELFTLNLKQ